MIAMDNSNPPGASPNTPKTITTRIVARFIVIITIVAALFFSLAGRLDWYAAWALLLAFSVYLVVIGLWARRHDPEMVAERISPGEGVKTWDQVIMAVYAVLLLVMLVVSLLDGGRFGWTSVPTWANLLGWLGCIFAGWLIWRVMKENTFLSERVRIQTERGHQVITTGPYRIVRHPMYAGVMVFLLSMPLILGSVYGFCLAIPAAALFVVRTVLEDRTLMNELPGYKEYARQTRYRLLPFIW
jgi:protein-S-isoprenylcysteine O-methyltransferase Ste14